MILFKEEHNIFRNSLRKFIEKEIQPFVEEWEEKRYFPDELFIKMGKQGFLGAIVPEKLGGFGGDYLYGAVMTEELTRSGSGGIEAGIGMHSLIVINSLIKYSTSEQKKRFLTQAIKGEKIGALGVTEPNTGSDVFNIQTKAEKKDGYYLLNGSKIFITNGIRADFVIVLAKTDSSAGYGGFTMLIVEKGFKGFSVSRKIDKVGWWASDTGELSFDDVKVPFENILGGEGEGFYQTMSNFEWERLIMALGSNAASQLALEQGLEYGKNRKAFGRPIGKFQIWRHRFAHYSSLLEAAKQLTYNGLELFNSGESCLKEVTMAKYVSTELANKIADMVLQFHGGYGYSMEYPLQRFWRDARIGTIGGGTSEIMLEIISKML